MKRFKLEEYAEHITKRYDEVHPTFFTHFRKNSNGIFACTSRIALFNDDFDINSYDELLKELSHTLEQYSTDDHLYYADRDIVKNETVNQNIEQHHSEAIGKENKRGNGNIIIDDQYMTYIGHYGTDLEDSGLRIFSNDEGCYAIVTIDHVRPLFGMNTYFRKLS